MNSLDSEILPNDLLFHIEHRIARRADELARSTDPLSSSHDYWREAEREVWEYDELVSISPAGSGDHENVPVSR